jgi:hypothetical protein
MYEYNINAGGAILDTRTYVAPSPFGALIRFSRLSCLQQAIPAKTRARLLPLDSSVPLRLEETHARGASHRAVHSCDAALLVTKIIPGLVDRPRGKPPQLPRIAILPIGRHYC